MNEPTNKVTKEREPLKWREHERGRFDTNTVVLCAYLPDLWGDKKPEQWVINPFRVPPSLSLAPFATPMASHHDHVIARGSIEQLQSLAQRLQDVISEAAEKEKGQA